MKILKSNQGGFTLIELLVVVAIISLLSSIVLASLKEAREKAKISKFRQEINQLITAIELYRTDNNGQFPFIGNMSGIQRDGTDSVWLTHVNGRAKLIGSGLINYISDFPKPPKSNAIFYFFHHQSTFCQGSNYMLLSYNLDFDFINEWTTYGAHKCYPLNKQ
jgi:prepilin-type N-terminal cleavage/methylation domain-containing protein